MTHRLCGKKRKLSHLSCIVFFLEMDEKMEIDHPLNNVWSQLQDPALSRELLTSDFEIFPTEPKQLGI